MQIDASNSVDDRFHFSMRQPLLTVEEVIGKLDELTLQSWDAKVILHHQVPLHLAAFQDDEASSLHYSTKEIFYDELLTDEEGWKTISTRLEALWLNCLPKLQNLCRDGRQIHHVLEVLEVLGVRECSSLGNLFPSSATFCHLTYLEVIQCNSLKSLMTSLTAGSLFKLQRMKIEQRDSLEEIVTEEVNETENDIAFNSLFSLELIYLPRLHSFSSSKCPFKFPWLDRVVVSQCPRMQIFSHKAISASKLKKVLTEEKDEGKFYWEREFNGTISKMFLNKVAFQSFERLELSKYPMFKVVCILEALSTWTSLKCECDTLEAVFDLGDIDERRMNARGTFQLKKMRLSNLPKLKHIWKHDSHELASLGNSGDIHASECQASNG
ncbi:uncharacterized protein LOC129288293 [Prosopis cineraria]|uniref:uncharacterized protein LOC129288293 n=1 Tax=Prosopis cineraria TaxID=364024 RepID=UPI00240EE9F4|nr:uncharacterized protein LOC129288293 [Prosopis cineraria]